MNWYAAWDVKVRAEDFGELCYAFFLGALGQISIPPSEKYLGKAWSYTKGIH